MDNEQIVAEIATLKAEVAGLKESDVELKESIRELVSKIDKMLFWMMGLLGTTVASIFVALVR